MKILNNTKYRLGFEIVVAPFDNCFIVEYYCIEIRRYVLSCSIVFVVIENNDAIWVDTEFCLKKQEYENKFL